MVGAASPVLPQQSVQAQSAIAQQLFALANDARVSAGVRPLLWDPALADAAMKHCQRMAVEGPIAHRYDGEPDLTARAGDAGAHFSLVEENIAVGSHLQTIHQGWLDSPKHRANLINPAVDHVGIAVVSSGGILFAVTDFSRAVDELTPAQVEAKFATLLHSHGLKIDGNTTDARRYCMSEDKWHGFDPPSFLFRWQGPDVTQLPEQVLEQLAVERYQKASVGSCAPHDVKEAFTVYRVAVLLY
jgi:Cysteine-rich secretory protein family